MRKADQPTQVWSWGRSDLKGWLYFNQDNKIFSEFSVDYRKATDHEQDCSIKIFPFVD